MRFLTFKNLSSPWFYVAALAGIVLIASLLSGCALNGASPGAYAPVSTSAAPTFPATRATYRVNARVCADATGSTSNTMPQFGPTMRSYIADAVSGWAHKAPADPSDSVPVDPAGADAQPGLSLQMRWVNTDPLSDMNALTVTVPAVDALVQEPAVTSKTFVKDDPAWQAAAENIADDSNNAVRAAKTAANSIKKFQWPNGNSGISACITALVQDLQPGHDVLLVASDGEENEPPQIAGNLHDAQVLWVMPNPSGNAAHEAKLQASWKTLLIRLGAKSVRFIRPETSSATLFANFMKGA